MAIFERFDLMARTPTYRQYVVSELENTVCVCVCVYTLPPVGFFRLRDI